MPLVVNVGDKNKYKFNPFPHSNQTTRLPNQIELCQTDRKTVKSTCKILFVPEVEQINMTMFKL